jgi:energy-coupling factor transporter ATP-binding protein EcfA2
MTVEGGFLDGLDLAFSKGLNVIIGGRGTGKTSVIELIRFCLGARSYTDESVTRSREHALAVLQDGVVTLTLATGTNRVTVSRTASDDAAPRLPFQLPIIFSQTDIESLGLESSGRLGLIASFLPRQTGADADDVKLLASVRSLTAEMQGLSKELETIESDLSTRNALEAQLKTVAEQEQNVTLQSKSAQEKQAELQATNQQISSLTVSADILGRTIHSFQSFEAKLHSISSVAPAIERWPKEAGEIDRLSFVRASLAEFLRDLNGLTERMRWLATQTSELSAAVGLEKQPLENHARELRKTIEQLQQGAGTISRAASQMREKLAQLKALASLRNEKRESLSRVQRARGQYLDKLDAIWERKFRDKIEIAERINSQLRPRIRVSPVRAAQVTQYATALSAALRGSNLKYTELSADIASRMSPRELVEVIEQGNVEMLAHALEISPDRAIKLIAHLKDHGTAEILTARVEDDIHLELLDGTEYKDIEELSTGQRCTVVLPIVLEHKDRVLIVDQPEDHLDNAFVAETLVRAILSRGTDAQLILSSHNANIPVLGDAAQVIVMGSDGRRGFADDTGPLHAPTIVQAITNIMEGGAEAFAQRAEFYRNYLGTNG